MKFPQLSIKRSFLLALIFLSAVVFLSSAIAVFTFERISAKQTELLSSSLPVMRLVNRTVKDGVELLAVGEALRQPVSAKKLSLLEERAATLWGQVSADADELKKIELELPKALNFAGNTQALMDNIRKQLFLQKNIVASQAELKKKRQALLDIIKLSLKDIKLLYSDFSLQLLNAPIQQKPFFRDQMSALTELRFSIVNLETLVKQQYLAAGLEQVAVAQSLYRLEMQKVGVNFLRFEESHRKKMAGNVSQLHERMLDKNNFFSQLRDQVVMRSDLADAQNKNLEISQVMSGFYNNILQSTNNNIDYEAKEIVELIGFSKIILAVTFLLFLASVFSLVFFFIQPRIVNRLSELAASTRAIYSNYYRVDIDTQGNDEISAMAESLSYFRDELIEKDIMTSRLADREKTLSTIIDNAQEGLFTVSLDGLVQSFNPACEYMFGISEEQALRLCVGDILPDEKAVFIIDEHYLEKENDLSVFVCKDKLVKGVKLQPNNESYRFYGSLSVSLINFSGRYIYSCFIRDVTEEFEAKEKVDALVTELSNSNTDLEAFAYSCSHDLQEPVRIISAFSHLLTEHLGPEIDETTSRYLSFIESNALNAKELIKSILEYSRLDTSAVEKQWVSVGSLCQQVHGMLTVLLEEKSATFEWSDEAINLLVVKPQMVQVVLNLVINGLRYNRHKKPQVVLSVKEHESYWLLCVEDNGIGIDARYHKKIFEVFNRLVSKNEYAGSGVGLSLCQRIVKKHGGDIYVESSPGEGSSFYISLPKPQSE